METQPEILRLQAGALSTAGGLPTSEATIQLLVAGVCAVV